MFKINPFFIHIMLEKRVYVKHKVFNPSANRFKNFLHRSN
ncbi:hypothetical protein D1AOALGA4SA_10442 [Olavius algarvensis Delta 1 endosymbiont]|nr:hypothetical protein D1AOALGA4SA_10442 [Olavius algarvensis Delta 1 endosymbiont]